MVLNVVSSVVTIMQEHLDDKHLSRFLEAEGSVDSVPLSDLRNPVDGAPTGVSQ